MDNSSTVCAFDIGIKNLAFCVMRIASVATAGDRANPRTILGWENVNILASEAAPTKRTCLKCSAVAKYSAGDKLYCKRHVGDGGLRPLSDEAGKPLLKVPPMTTLRGIGGNAKSKEAIVADLAT